ncbi:MAG: DeoR/GlpR family DNA-binding transcription regulator [Bacilli bacterium]
MIPIKRKEHILNELRNHDICFIEDLAKTIGTSEQTIRRDLMSLEEDGLVERYHGGGARLLDTSKETSFDQRLQRFTIDKDTIGKLAASLVEAGDVIFVDAGTTTAAMLTYLDNKDVTIFTNGIIHINILESLNIKTFMVGGELKRRTGCFIGPMALNTIKNCYFDKVFIGANGISHELGCTNADINESELKNALVTHSKKAYVLCDSTKFNVKSFHKFAELNDVYIITNQVPDYFNSENLNIISQTD